MKQRYGNPAFREFYKEIFSCMEEIKELEGKQYLILFRLNLEFKIYFNLIMIFIFRVH